MVRVNCHIQFTRSDVDFLLPHASKHTLSSIGSRSDLTVEEIDWMLDDETVIWRAYEARDFARFSAHFFFYAGVRWCLRIYDIDNRNLVDYETSMLSQFCV
ncbi:MAG: hypothetical protein VYA69_11045 [Gemmatimonadota bacterium]|nr:hypothetical protein [Gemmatimonadota bacterium]